VLHVCTFGWYLCGVTARSQHGPATSGCPGCGRPPQDELHFALECPAYPYLRALHIPLFASFHDPELALHLLFCPPHFRSLVCFLHAGHVQRVACVAGRRPCALPLEAVLPCAFAVPPARVMFFPDRVYLCLLVVGWFFAACGLVVAWLLLLLFSPNLSCRLPDPWAIVWPAWVCVKGHGIWSWCNGGH